jgi:hypothetical protein
MEYNRITSLGIQEIELLDGKKYKIRPLTIKEKRDYLVLTDEIKKKFEEEVKTAVEASEADKAVTQKEIDKLGDSYIYNYLSLQVEVGYFLLRVLNPDIKKEELENSINGSLLKYMIDVAFFDPFQGK